LIGNLSEKKSMLTKDKSERELLADAREAEASEEFGKAIDLYKILIRKNDLEPLYYDRLMIIYRRQQELKNELEVINKGIKAFEQYFSSRAEKLFSKHKQQVTKLSNALMKKTGLKSTNHEYFPEPLNKWRKRKQLVLKKLS
jgi:hypothetical protein